MKFETKAIRIQTKRSEHREHSTPIFPTSSFVFENAEQMQAIFGGEEKGNIYSRFTNPSAREFEEKMAALEGVENAMATATGMAAVFASFMAHLKKGDHVIASRAVFGSSFQILAQTLPNYGITTTYINPLMPETWSEALNENTKMFFLETPSNPGLAVVDLVKASKFAKENNLLLNVDNCFATPYLQNPAKYGADIITHSATKFIDGQGRVMGGIVAGNHELVERVYLFIRRTGGSISPFNAWVLSKSLETLAIRMDRHCQNALSLAKWLETQPNVSNVRYPFLESHPQYEIAKKQMRQGGGIVTFEIEGGIESGVNFLNSLNMLSLTANLGDSRSIASHPASTTHLRVPNEEHLKVGITEGLIRISVGLEHIDDIIDDIENALKW
ncbi:O-succinylhomoserine sulfhydrylase [Saprospiraceae bacterium]|jgi:O-succinylhomoserine sulfhydrylase|nr:O-succinylhomoserine sulfhydrylase [Bacteroidota bacterium]MDB4727178.1 O-succinylhomoserine sulfhydrylase [Saprospiraceae bacterium]MDF1863414.1 O-succinylhomoserine sulfhydrylase [Saprospiraceae bacterium]